MVEIAGKKDAVSQLKRSLTRNAILVGVVGLGVAIVYGSCTATVAPNQYGVEQHRFGLKTGIMETVYGPGLYFSPPGATMHHFPREIHVLEASFDEEDARARAGGNIGQIESVKSYFAKREQVLGETTHKVIPALLIQTSDGYAVNADVTLLYAISDPVKLAKEFGWGSLYVDGFVISTFRNTLLATLGKMNAEDFYDPEKRNAAVTDAEDTMRSRFKERGFDVHKLLIRNYKYAGNYEKAMLDKKVAVQITERNRKEGVVNEERAQLQQIESKGNAEIVIAESIVNAEISKIRAEATLYAAEVRAKADKEGGLAEAESKRLKAEALVAGKTLVALDMATMFDGVETAVMTPEQYVQFIRSAWSLMGLQP